MRKATFSQGFKSGWAAYTQGPLAYLHQLENSLTGRGLRNSHINSAYRDAYQPMRRNLRASIGHVVGGVIGTLASIATLGILPIYKSVRDGFDRQHGPPNQRQSQRKKRIIYRHPAANHQYATA